MMSNMDDVITTAVKFLQNPKVRQSPLATRRVFLKKKGLTDEEVELAILRSGSTDEVLALSPLGPPQTLPVTHPRRASPPPPPGGGAEPPATGAGLYYRGAARPPPPRIHPTQKKKSA
ncbi:unnamed protein product [Boreogadus saida]